MKKTLAILALLVLSTATMSGGAAAEQSKVREATRQVEQGAKTTGEGVAETAKGVGRTVVEGAKATGQSVEGAGKAAEPEAKNAWERFKDSATSFGHSVKTFFTRLVNKE